MVTSWFIFSANLQRSAAGSLTYSGGSGEENENWRKEGGEKTTSHGQKLCSHEL